ncbi:hypothetical protein BT69DRAFT_1335957 [Atractiella rhizophila]|nr:hypothetical protein BT69DRAFT_1335957 [Atractiella rhizophila]
MKKSTTPLEGLHYEVGADGVRQKLSMNSMVTSPSHLTLGLAEVGTQDSLAIPGAEDGDAIATPRLSTTLS